MPFSVYSLIMGNETKQSAIINQTSHPLSVLFPKAHPAGVAHNYLRLIPLTQGQFAIVDIDDLKELSKYKWCISKSDGGYLTAIRSEHSTKIRMHREIMQTPDGMDTDHINHNTLDNRRCNLRICTRSQNNHNRLRAKNKSSRYKGVAWHQPSNKWIVQISKDRKPYYLGLHKNEKDAAKIYNKAASELHGEFANLNVL